MSRSKKWRLEWAFFLGENGRRKYNKVCKGCAHPCKQSFRAVLIFEGCREAVLNTFP